MPAQTNDTDSLCLVPLRDGSPLLSDNDRALITIRKRGHTIVGRLELMSCLYAACGCDANVFSSKGKCTKCQSVSQWALLAISRQMLRIRKGSHLSVRGSHALVVISTADQSSTISCFDEDSHATECPDAWRGEQIISPGMVISLRELDGEGQLNFLVTSAMGRSPNRIDLKSIPQRKEEDNWMGDDVSVMAKVVGNDNSLVSTMQNDKKIRIWFCPMGQDLSRQRLVILRKEAKLRGALVVEDYTEASHVVISGYVDSLEKVSEYLGKSRKDIENHFVVNHVWCVLPRWLLRQPQQIIRKKPAYMDLWPGYMPKRKKPSCPPQRKNQELCNKKPNQELSSAFLKLSKLYQSSPVFPEDIWKAYTFHKLSGRLLNLDFDVRVDPSFFLPILKKIPGFSFSTIAMLEELIKFGKMQRIENLQNDPVRVAMKNMMSIWGVGRATALDLVQRGYGTIGHVRDGIRTGKLRLTRNQLVGVECYEDLLEEMNRDEVECIGSIVVDAIKLLGYSTAEATIMGSFRRGKSTSGDVDVLITFQDYPYNVPKGALRSLVDMLWDQGHIAYHLTFLPGMDTGVQYNQEETDNGSSPVNASLLPLLAHFSKIPSLPKSSSSYMGVFNSPKEPGKRRRVDIKIYPEKQKPFACLYFTGSPHFNRSMRLWAKQKFGFQLTDRGLFDNAGKLVVDGASKEEEIFQVLKLAYKRPQDRGYFDDVVPLC